MDRELIMKRVGEHLDFFLEREHMEWVGIFLAGSQNYGLDYEGSDVDTKVIVIPSFEDIAMGRPPVSRVLVLPNNEHVEVKDVRLMFQCFRKQNINFVEILFTEYRILNPKYESIFQPLFDANERIGRYNVKAALACMLGMINEKRRALTKPTPASQDVIAKYGYEGKQLHHMERLLDFMKDYISRYPYWIALRSNRPEYLIALKKNEYPADQAIARADKVVEEASSLYHTFTDGKTFDVNASVDELLDDVQKKLIRRSLRSELPPTEEV